MKIDPTVLQELRKAYKQILTSGGMVEVISAHDMSDSEKKSLIEKLPMLKDAQITYSKDTSILAGVIIKFGSKMIDLSLQNELTNLKHFIYERI
jgi:F0F1-type ATP synthase delta subunit